MSVVIRIVSAEGQIIDGSMPSTVGTHVYLESYDPDAHEGMGDATWTGSLGKAMRFENQLQAMQFYRQGSKVAPYRSDGRANRPLTAFSVEFINVDEFVV